MNKTLTKKQDGFTIIEVLIVLAIAALILVVVLIAVPQLQQNQRNNARQAVANRIVAELNNYAGNNNGNYPVANTAADRRNLGTPGEQNSFFGRYFECADVGGLAECQINIDDPQTGEPVGTISSTTSSVQPAASVRVRPTSSNTESIGDNAPGTDAGSFHYATESVCDGELATRTGAVPRNFSFQIRLEGGAIYCLDNS